MARLTGEQTEHRRRQILDAAVRTFASRGFGNATMAEIADEAGLSAGALYRYFVNKQALADACFSEGAEALAEQWRAQVAAAPDAQSAFFAIAKHSFDEIQSEGADDRTRLMIEHFLEVSRPGADGIEEAQGERTVIIEGLATTIRSVQAEGNLSPDIDPSSLGAALWSFWLGARVSRLIDPRADVEGQLAAVWTAMTQRA